MCKFSTRHLAPLLAFILVGTFFWAAMAGAAMPAMTGDGWHTWRVAAHAEAPDWCCFTWSGGAARAGSCNLDARNSGYGSSGDAALHPEFVQVYANLSGGKTTDLRTVSANCPVHSTDTPVDHGMVESADSVAWLQAQMKTNGKLAADALTSIAVHEGASAHRALVDTARSDRSLENRKAAIFWMAQARARETGNEIKALMFRDASPAVREHAAFSLSQSRVEDRAAALARLGTADAEPQVRGQAWFWLAQTGDSSAPAAILAALNTESSRTVREEMVFALSELPGEAGADALITIIENRQYSGTLRKRALFWLAQDESDRASAYLASVFER